MIEMPLKEIAKVGKRLLIQIAGVCENYKVKEIVEEIDFHSCPVECGLSQFNIERKKDICMNHCPFNQKKQFTKVAYMNERHRYKIKQKTIVEHERLSKYQLLQLLTYHFFVDSNGFASFVSVKALSEHLGCTKRTIKNNNKTLQRLGLISFSEYGADLFSMEIKGYKENHLTKEQGGTGYVQMSKTFLESIISMDNVNVMRLSIRALLKYDTEVEVAKKDSCIYSYNDIKRFMPSNINHKKIIDELMEKTAEIFVILTTDTHISIQLKETHNGKIQKKEKEKLYSESIEKHAQHINEQMDDEELLSFDEKDMSDLVQLSMEYGFKSVQRALYVYVNHIRNTKTPDVIHNIGGFIRTVIKNERRLNLDMKTA